MTISNEMLILVMSRIKLEVFLRFIIFLYFPAKNVKIYHLKLLREVGPNVYINVEPKPW